jgi:hypothetical protein
MIVKLNPTSLTRASEDLRWAETMTAGNQPERARDSALAALDNLCDALRLSDRAKAAIHAIARVKSGEAVRSERELAEERREIIEECERPYSHERDLRRPELVR